MEVTMKTFRQIMEEVKDQNMAALERKAVIANQTAKIARGETSRQLSYRVKHKMIYHALAHDHAHINGSRDGNILGITFTTGKRLHLKWRRGHEV